MKSHTGIQLGIPHIWFPLKPLQSSSLIAPPAETPRLALRLPLAAHQPSLDLDDRVVGPRAPSLETADHTATDHHLVAQGEMLDFKPDLLVDRELFRTSIQICTLQSLC
jgi:hypothetical protein